jgi:hypothetical protein
MSVRAAAPPWMWPAAAAGATVLALIAAVLAPGGLRAWLAATVLCSSVPVGALALAMMMRLIPGGWASELEGAVDSAAFTLPIAGLMIAPVLFDLTGLYPWVHQAQATAFRAAWLTPFFFAGRTIGWVAVMWAIAWSLLAAPAPRANWISCIGLVLFPMLGSLVAEDWLMTLDPKFASSGFGLYVIGAQMPVALAFLMIVRLTAADAPERTGILGSLLLTLLLIWGYLGFMQYFISWSEDLPINVAWYQRREPHGWKAAIEVSIALRLIPMFLLLFGPVRRSRRALVGICAAVLVGAALEFAWLALPQAPESQPQAPAIGVFVLAVLALGAVTMAAYRWAEARAPGRPAHA